MTHSHPQFRLHRRGFSVGQLQLFMAPLAAPSFVGRRWYETPAGGGDLRLSGDPADPTPTSWQSRDHQGADTSLAAIELQRS